MKPAYNNSGLKTTEKFIGESIEQKCRRVTEGNQPIEAVSPMYYQERKAGIENATNIRTDKWDVALQAMDSIAVGTRKKREEKIQQKVNEGLKTDKPDAQ